MSDAGAALYRRRTSARLPPLPPTTSPPLFRGAQRRPRNTPPPSGTIRGKNGVFSTISRQKNAGLASQHPRHFSVIWRPPRAVRDADFPGAAPAPAGAWSIKGRSRGLFCGPRRRPKPRGGSRTARVGSVHLRRYARPACGSKGGSTDPPDLEVPSTAPPHPSVSGREPERTPPGPPRGSVGAPGAPDGLGVGLGGPPERTDVPPCPARRRGAAGRRDMSKGGVGVAPGAGLGPGRPVMALDGPPSPDSPMPRRPWPARTWPLLLSLGGGGRVRRGSVRRGVQAGVVRVRDWALGVGWWPNRRPSSPGLGAREARPHSRKRP